MHIVCIVRRNSFIIYRSALLTSFVEVRRAFTSIWLVAPRDLIFFQDAMTDNGTGQEKYIYVCDSNVVRSCII